MKKVRERNIFVTYEIALLLKASQAFLEVVAGILFYAISTTAITTFILFIAHGELAESPNGIVSNFLIQSAHQLSVSGKFFIGFYLLIHGIIKLVLIFWIVRKKIVGVSCFARWTGWIDFVSTVQPDNPLFYSFITIDRCRQYYLVADSARA